MSKHERNDFSNQEALPPLHTVFQGQVASVQKYGAFISIPGYKRHGLVHISQMSSAHIDDPAEMLAKGEKVFCKTDGSKIGLSMKLVNQTTGQDLDPNNVQLSQDEKKRKRFFAGERPPIELGAVYDTKCRHCGGHGHLAMDCFVGKGGKQYELVPELDDMIQSEVQAEAPSRTAESSRQRKKKKKEKKGKKRQHSSTAIDSESDTDSARKVKKKRKKRHHSSSSESSGQVKLKHKKSSTRNKR